MRLVSTGIFSDMYHIVINIIFSGIVVTKRENTLNILRICVDCLRSKWTGRNCYEQLSEFISIFDSLDRVDDVPFLELDHSHE